MHAQKTLPPRTQPKCDPSFEPWARRSRVAANLTTLTVGLSIGAGSILAFERLFPPVDERSAVAPASLPEPTPTPSPADTVASEPTSEPPVTPAVVPSDTAEERAADRARPRPKTGSRPRRTPEARGAVGAESFEARARAAGLRVQLRAASGSKGERYIAHVDWIPSAADRLAALADPELTARDLLNRVARQVRMHARESQVQLATLELHNEENRRGWRMSARCMTKVAGSAATPAGPRGESGDPFTCVESVDFP